MNLSDLIPFYHHHDQIPEGMDDSACSVLDAPDVFADPAVDATVVAAVDPVAAWLNEPQVEIEESGREVVVTAEIPDIAARDLDVRLEEKGLRVRSDAHRHGEDNAPEAATGMRWYGRFECFVPLPCPVDGTRAEASVHAGVLTVRLPRTPEATPLRIPVQAA